MAAPLPWCRLRWLGQLAGCMLVSALLMGMCCMHGLERAKTLEARRSLAAALQSREADLDVTAPAGSGSGGLQLITDRDEALAAEPSETPCPKGKMWDAKIKKCTGSFHTAPWSSWLWWPFGLYLFWAQAEVCDKFFVPSVQVCSDMFRIPEDVAGATLMALGCNGPELAVNAIAIFITKSPVGVGTIVGSDVFNLLVICGCSVLAAPKSPVKLNASTLTRDVLFYAISILLLIFVISDGRVELWQAAMLSGMVVVYGTSVALWSRLDKCFKGTAAEEEPPQEPELRRASTTPGGRVSRCEDLLAAGLSVEVRKGGRRGRFETRMGREHWAKRFMRLDSDVGVLKLCRPGRSRVETSDTVMRTTSAPSPTNGAGGDVEDPRECFALGGISGNVDIPVKDILECIKGDENTFIMHYVDKEADAINAAQMLDQVLQGPMSPNGLKATLEFRVSNQAVQEALVEGLSQTTVTGAPSLEDYAELVDEHRHALEALDPSRRTCKQHLLSVVNWFCFPVLLVLEVSVPKCFVPSQKTKWPLTFCMAMVWLAFFSYWICVMADEVNDAFGVPESVLGLTLTAMGTSFPNCVASVIVARKGQCSMAVANALGSNIQNVFLALGIPWLANAAVSGGWFPQPTEGISAGVISMAGSLGLFVLFALIGCSTMGKAAAYVFLVGYIVFFVVTILEGYEVM